MAIILPLGVNTENQIDITGYRLVNDEWAVQVLGTDSSLLVHIPDSALEEDEDAESLLSIWVVTPGKADLVVEDWVVDHRHDLIETDEGVPGQPLAKNTRFGGAPYEVYIAYSAD